MNAANPVDHLTASVDPAEVERFSAMAAQWWDPAGKFAVLHKFNPVRLLYIREQVTARMRIEPRQRTPFSGLDLLDIGCGGGLLSEPMCRLGASVTAIDPSDKNIKTASVHASEQELDIRYLATTAESLAAAGHRYDVILNMEVVEHVNDPEAFVATCASMLKPGGLMFVATLNRTLKAFALAIIGAEYVLGWLPRGTHQWEKFITPQELSTWLEAGGCEVLDTTGVVYSPLTDSWRRAADTDVNYMMVVQRRSGCTPAGV